VINSVNVIFPYQHEDIWVFDDESVGLVREPFVSGVPQMIEFLIKDIPNLDRGFTLFFGEIPFPDYQVKLDWVQEEYGGNWYIWKPKNLKGWLCPALFKYFSKTPKKIYCKAEPRK
jgi:hypothetical protein